MSFNIHTRSRSPVLSIQTQPEQEQRLAAAIQAAYTQQKIVKERESKFLRETSAATTFEPHTVNRRCLCSNCAQPRLSADGSQDLTIHHTSTRSRKYLRSAIKEELSSAKNFLKDTSKRHLQKIRTHTTRTANRIPHHEHESHSECNTQPDGISLASLTRRHTGISECGQSVSISSEHAPAELSGSEPLVVYQLSERPKSPERRADSRISIPPPYDDGKKTPIARSDTDGSESQIDSLQSETSFCNNCHHQLRGKDYYDFCPRCPPGSRVLCIICAAGGGCSQHRSEYLIQQFCDLPRRSPAPSYNHNDNYEAGRLESLNIAIEPVSCHRSVSPLMRQKQTLWLESGTFRPAKPSHQGSGCPGVYPQPHIGTGQTDVVTLESLSEAEFIETTRLNASMSDGSKSSQHQSTHHKKTPLSGRKAVSEARETCMREREMALREHQAAIREQQISNKEHELMIKQRESLAQDRDALLVQHLQTIVAFQELARAHHIGAQFSGSKESFEHLQCANVSRSGSSSSFASEISLLRDGQQHPMKPSLSRAVADVEAMIDQSNTDDRRFRAHASKRKKGQKSDAAQSVTSANKAYTGTTQPVRSKNLCGIDEDGEDEADEGLTPPKKQKQEPPDSQEPQKIFACPYCKHDRPRYSALNLREKNYRGCSGHYLPDIPRLKQHLRRVHWRPENHCPRCFDMFRTPAELDKHLTSSLGCAVRECPFPEKMDTHQRQQIHVKRPKTPPETLWYDIYRILFPESPLPESPYAEKEDLLTPPSSATTSTVTQSEAAHMLKDILMNRLSKKAQMSDQLCDLISQELLASMTDLLSTISIAHETSPGALSSALSSGPMSILISPAPSYTENFPEELSSCKPETSGSPSHHKAEVIIPRLEVQKTPQLHEPKYCLGPSLKPPISIPASITNVHTEAFRGHNPNPRAQVYCSNGDNLPPWSEGQYREAQCATSLFVQSDPDQNSSQNSGLAFPEFDLQLPAHVREDNGYDEESWSYEQGDDHHAMVEAVQITPNQDLSSGSGGPRALARGKPQRMPRPPRDFVPVRLQALEDLPPDQAGHGQPFRPNNSIGSLIDSGYGSGNSDHLALRSSEASCNIVDERIANAESSLVGHMSFDEQFEMLKADEQYEMWKAAAQIQTFNPWHTEADIGNAI